MKTRLVLPAVLVSMLGLMLFCVLKAFGEAGHGGDHHAGGHEAASDQQLGIDSVEDIWNAIHVKHIELAKIVKNEQLTKVHKLAFAIRDLSQALPKKAAADKKARVEGAVRNISKLANLLDASGDAGNQELTEINLKKLDGTLKILEAQFSQSEH